MLKNIEQKWELVGRNEKYTDDELFNRLMNSEKKIVVLDGYSSCGKTMLLRRLREHSAKPVLIFTDEKLISIMMREVENKAWNHSQLLEASQEEAIICIEDIDLMRGKTVTLEMVKIRVQKAIEKHLLILTGNDLCENMPEFLSAVSSEVWKKYRP